VLYDVSSTYFEGRACELAKFGHNQDGKSGKNANRVRPIVRQDGCPVAIEVFDGNVADPATLANQVKKHKERFALKRVVLVGDRGRITEARIEEVLKPAGLDWITTLRARAIRSLAEAGSLQLSLFDECDLATIASLDYPGERLVVACNNPLLADERARIA
jgi:transposase